MSHESLLSVITFLPCLGIIVLLWLPKGADDGCKWVALASTVLVLLACGLLMGEFESGRNSIQFEVNVPWITSLGASYHMGVDGISMPLVVLTALQTMLQRRQSHEADHDVVVQYDAPNGHEHGPDAWPWPQSRAIRGVRQASLRKRCDARTTHQNQTQTKPVILAAPT